MKDGKNFLRTKKQASKIKPVTNKYKYVISLILTLSFLESLC